MKPRNATDLERSIFMKKVTLVVFYLVSILVAAEWSAHSAMKNQMAAFGVILERTQSELSLRHVLRYSELEANLEKGCKTWCLRSSKFRLLLKANGFLPL